MSKFRKYNELSTFDSVCDSSHENRRCVVVAIARNHQGGNLSAFEPPHLTD